jgi:CheY-like chemotaxis protein
MRGPFAQALRELRKRRSLTQDDFSLASSRTYLSSLERGLKTPTLDKIDTLAGILGVHPLTLLAFTYQKLDSVNSMTRLLRQVYDDLKTMEGPNKMIRLFITDDHAIVRAGLKQLFALFDDIYVVGEADSGEGLLTHHAIHNIDVVLLDMSMPGLSGVSLIKRLRNEHPQLLILVLSMHLDQNLAQNAINAGACGYVAKDVDPETLLLAIRSVFAGGSFVDSRLGLPASTYG